jgi:Predicted membrane-associated HD superfamily hydrolase
MLLLGGTGMENVLYLTVASAVGVGMGAFIPPFVKRVVGFKCRQYGRPLVRRRFSVRTWGFVIVLTVAFALLSARFVSLEQSPFFIGFCVIAIVGTLVDHQIRMIPNELVLLLFMLGLPYRIMVSGFSGVPRSMLASLITAGVFLLAAGTTFLLKKNIGVGAGDLKLAVTISFIVGLSGVFLFLFGMVAAILLYCFGGLLSRRLTVGSTFPMCGQIMAGFVFALFAPYVVPCLSEYLLLPL